MKAFTISRQGAPPSCLIRSQLVASLRLLNPLQEVLPWLRSFHPWGRDHRSEFATGPRPLATNWKSDTSVAGLCLSLIECLAVAYRESDSKLRCLLPVLGTGANSPSPRPQSGVPPGTGPMDSVFNKYSDFIDTRTGTLKFKNKAVIHGGGIEFSSGHSFSISLDEVDRMEELGKGNYAPCSRSVTVVRTFADQASECLALSVDRPGPEGPNSLSPTAQDNLPALLWP